MLICLTTLTIKSSSPLKMAISICLLSVLASSLVYSKFLLVYPTCATVISFSSGMMILFCYCSLMCNYEMEQKPLYAVTLSSILILTCLPTPSSQEMSYPESSSTILNSPLICSIVGVILISMICMNKSIFNPSKPLMSTY